MLRAKVAESHTGTLVATRLNGDPLTDSIRVESGSPEEVVSALEADGFLREEVEAFLGSRVWGWWNPMRVHVVATLRK